MGQDLISRHSKVFKIYTKYLSCLANNQVGNIFVCHLCPCLSSWPQKLRQTAAKPQRTWHVKECCCMSREFVRSYDTFTGITEILCRKTFCMWGELRAFFGPLYFYSTPLEVKSFCTRCLCLCSCQTKTKRAGVGGKFQLCAYGFRMGWPFVCFFLAWRTGIIFSFAFSGKRRHGPR